MAVLGHLDAGRDDCRNGPIVIGLVFMLVGVLVSLTIIGAIVGIPLAIIGFLLVVRGIF